jgi:hypothetical protein
VDDFWIILDQIESLLPLFLLLIPSQSQLCSFFVPGFYDQEQLLPTHTMAFNLFNAATLTLFFDDANNMGLSNRTRLQLAVEGITDLEDFNSLTAMDGHHRPLSRVAL